MVKTGAAGALHSNEASQRLAEAAERAGIDAAELAQILVRTRLV
jgi:hypothetical protein